MRSRLRAERHKAERQGVISAIQRTARQSPYKMRLVVDQIRGKDVNEALGLLRFSKKHAAVQIAKVLNSAVANAEFKAREGDESIDVDTLFIKHIVVNEGPALRRFMPAAQGRATPIRKRTSHIEIVLEAREVPRVPRSTRTGEGSIAKVRKSEGSTAKASSSSKGKR
ncbi:MAG: 50S ribosomal protein L22 [Thermoanaerobaculia bacterium]